MRPAHTRAAWLAAGWLLLQLALPAAAQTLDSLQEQGTAPEALQADLKALRGYYGQVQQRTKGAAPSWTPSPERDPFQVTPELRARRARGGIVPAPAASPLGASEAAASDDWQVQALVLGARSLAVLVRDNAADANTRDAGRAQPQRRSAAQRQLQRYVRVGDTLDMPDGRSWRVIGIDREGVLVQGSSAEIDTLRIR